MDQGTIATPEEQEAREGQTHLKRIERPVEGAFTDHDAQNDTDQVLAEIHALEKHRADLLSQLQTLEERVGPETVDVLISKGLQTPEGIDALKQYKETEKRLDAVTEKHLAALLKASDPDGEIKGEIISELMRLDARRGFDYAYQRALSTGRMDIVDGLHDAKIRGATEIENAKALGMTEGHPA